MFQELRNRYPQFIYDHFTVTETTEQWCVTYTFIIEELTFQPRITILKKDVTNAKIDKKYLNYLFFQYGLFDLMNYYKLTCSPKIVIKPMYISMEQTEFLKKILYNGLGEYFYKNDIDLSYEEFLNFEVIAEPKYQLPVLDGEYSGNLIPVGGGKDSIVTLELLKADQKENKLLMLERNLYPKNKAGYESIAIAGYQETDIVIFRNDLDLQLLELNKKGYLNGHIPFSACLSMASIIMAYLTNKKYIVLSNEASANEGNNEQLNINHQYSKSYEYEKDFRNYTSKYLNSQIEYFSLLRCWNEYQIVQEFLKHKKYLKVFRSCNRGTKQNIWCNHCSKCLYVYIMLYPHLAEQELQQIFDHDLLNDPSLESEFWGLVMEDEIKPFECVGTKLEINYSLQQALKRKQGPFPYLLELYHKKNQPKIPKNIVEDYLNKEHFIPKRYLRLVENQNER
ncbi:MAG: hypothetical protein PUB18_00450 [bacterium]|nr:hypothetical protein [bacterium]